MRGTTLEPELPVLPEMQDRTRTRFTSWSGRHIATDIANNGAKVRARTPNGWYAAARTTGQDGRKAMTEVFGFT